MMTGVAHSAELRRSYCRIVFLEVSVLLQLKQKVRGRRRQHRGWTFFSGGKLLCGTEWLNTDTFLHTEG